jgi:hypothetical protein
VWEERWNWVWAAIVMGAAILAGGAYGSALRAAFLLVEPKR